ncbi:hypothetical protein TNIN_405391 [Trichonephila inaurata madagascariensis]|uniref:Uncharacterized protein n=1 Tax=Trichonephila inaurata madagascariensis TaxID=2747483 RepID=A0A8X6WW68_9ARAC|nr:hypothetical protein TNIN_405391 [Trichonephila inaurata madagascariensis]
MAPPLDTSESDDSKPEATPIPPREKRLPKPTTNDNEPFGFMDAILELKKFFADYPSQSWADSSETHKETKE